MRILFLNNYNYLRGGSERVLFEEMRMLKEAGHRVAVYSRANRLNEPSEYDRFFPPDMETASPGISPAAVRTAVDLVHSRAAREGLVKVLDEFRPDIAHAHNIYGRLSLSVLDALKERGIPVVMTLHDYKIICPSYLMLDHGTVCERCRGGRFINAVLTRCHKDSLSASLLYAFESWFNRRYRKYDSVRIFICPSRFLMEKIIDFGRESKRIVFIANCIDSASIDMSGEQGRYLLYFGRLSREKGIHTLLEAVSSLAPNSLQIAIAGEGPERPALETRARSSGQDITFTGRLDGKALRNAVGGAKAVVVPSEWYENAPLSIIESFAHSRPVIGARIGGIPDMIDHGTNGFLFTPGDAEDLRKTISRFMSLDSDTVAKMRLAARRKAETEYGPRTHFDKLISLYRYVRNGDEVECASPM